SAAFPDLERVITLGGAEQPGALWWPECLESASRVTAEAVDELSAAIDPDEPIMILYTSGTTGFPKGVQHSHRPIRALVDRSSRLGITARDVFLCNLPLFHLYGLSEMGMMSLVTGSKLVLTEGFDPEESVRLIERERVTMLHGFDVHYAGLMAAREQTGADVSSMRVGSIPAGMGSTLPVVRRVIEEFCPVVSAYGLTEGWACGAIGFLDGSHEQRCETSGYPMPGYEFAVVDSESGEPVPDGEPGEILLRGYLVMQGYYREPELTAEAVDAGGWLHTGDMGIMRDDGYLRFVGRYKDMLKVGGENVSPMEVEGFLLDALPLELVAIVGHPDETLDEVPIAFVVPTKPGETDASALEQQVAEACQGKIASFKIPRRVFVLDEMPMTASGKIQKHKLRDSAAELLATG
ncbi:MAG: class I adenylate-forming enzyme family protein, partial [Gaiellaceae bacterium]